MQHRVVLGRCSLFLLKGNLGNLGNSTANLTDSNALRYYAPVTPGRRSLGNRGNRLGVRSTSTWRVTRVTLLGVGMGNSREQPLSRMVTRDARKCYPCYLCYLCTWERDESFLRIMWSTSVGSSPPVSPRISALKW